MNRSLQPGILADLQSLRRLAQRYEALASSAGSIVWVVDPSLHPTGRNEAWERYTGQTAEEYARLGWLSAVHPDEVARIRAAADRALSSGEALTLEMRIRRADGAFRRHLIRAVPVRDGDTVVEWIGTATDIEDLRQAADDLATMEERIRLAHAAAGVGTWEWQLEKDQVKWSTEIYRLLGFEENVPPNADLWTERIHPEDRDDVEERWNAVLASEATHFSDTFRMMMPNGEVRWILTSAVIFRLPSGAPVRAVGLNMDVTAQRTLQDQMSHALAEQQDLRSRLLEMTDGAEALLALRDEESARAGVLDLAARVLPADAYAIWWLDAATREWSIVHSSGLSAEFAAQRLEGEPTKFVRLLAIDTADERELPAERRRAYRAEGIGSLLTLPLPIRGERRAALVTYHRSPHRATETEIRVGMALGQIAAAALGNAEINAAQDRAQAAAERQATRMAYLADASAVLGSLDYETTLRHLARMAVPRVADWCAIDLLQPDNAVVRIETAHEDPSHADLAALFNQRVPPDPRASAGLSKVLRTGVPEYLPRITEEIISARAQNEQHLRQIRALAPQSALIAPLTARGHTIGAISFISTRPDRLFDEEDVTVLMEVARRAALAVDNARLYHEAEAANRVKDEFLVLLSHELRTPLNAIMGWSHMLRHGLAEEMRGHALEVISRNAQAQKKLVEDLLDVARLTGGPLELRCMPEDLREIGRTAVDSVRPAAHAREIRLSFAAPPTPVMVSADANRLHQVAANLLGNALKFTQSGGTISVHVSQSETEADLVVSDTGSGIAPEFLPYAFERFRQADTTLQRNHSGLGLGLWLVKQIAEAHGGRAKADSAGYGLGATITVTLPLLAVGSPPPSHGIAAQG